MKPLQADSGQVVEPLAGTCDPQRRVDPRFRGIAALRFQDCGLLDWDTPVRLALPARAARASATVETEFARDPTSVGAERQILGVRW